MDQVLLDVAAYVPGRCFVAALFYTKWRHGRHLKIITSHQKFGSHQRKEEQHAE